LTLPSYIKIVYVNTCILGGQAYWRKAQSLIKQGQYGRALDAARICLKISQAQGAIYDIVTDCKALIKEAKFRMLYTSDELGGHIAGGKQPPTLSPYKLSNIILI
jgi:hypothetical protein